mmetsp:Transcript_13623/g.39047  ORF Transcript_13623/g.39047 Transcript_13623/m.39047 type:complete len:227 (+) Transcript_13623:1118-1798(+)
MGAEEEATLTSGADVLVIIGVSSRFRMAILPGASAAPAAVSPPLPFFCFGLDLGRFFSSGFCFCCCFFASAFFTTSLGAGTTSSVSPSLLAAEGDNRSIGLSRACWTKPGGGAGFGTTMGVGAGVGGTPAAPGGGGMEAKAPSLCKAAIPGGGGVRTGGRGLDADRAAGALEGAGAGAPPVVPAASAPSQLENGSAPDAAGAAAAGAALSPSSSESSSPSSSSSSS